MVRLDVVTKRAQTFMCRAFDMSGDARDMPGVFAAARDVPRERTRLRWSPAAAPRLRASLRALEARTLGDVTHFTADLAVQTNTRIE